MTKETNIASAALIKSTVDFFKADLTLAAKRESLGKSLTADGFKIETDFAAKSAKEAGREDRFRAIQFLAQEGMPAAVKTALRDTSVPGDRKIKADGVTLTKTEWSKRVPGKVRDLKNAYALFIKTGQDPEGNGANANAPRDLLQRITEEIGKLHKAVAKDRDAEAPTLKVDHAAVLAAFVRASDLASGKAK